MVDTFGADVDAVGAVSLGTKAITVGILMFLIKTSPLQTQAATINAIVPKVGQILQKKIRYDNHNVST